MELDGCPVFFFVKAEFSRSGSNIDGCECGSADRRKNACFYNNIELRLRPSVKTICHF